MDETAFSGMIVSSPLLPKILPQIHAWDDGKMGHLH